MRSNLDVKATLVADEFIDRYMPAANGEYVKVYLYLLRHRERQVTVVELADALDHTESDIRRALSYWIRLGVLANEGRAEVSAVSGAAGAEPFDAAGSAERAAAAGVSDSSGSAAPSEQSGAAGGAGQAGSGASSGTPAAPGAAGSSGTAVESAPSGSAMERAAMSGGVLELGVPAAPARPAPQEGGVASSGVSAREGAGSSGAAGKLVPSGSADPSERSAASGVPVPSGSADPSGQSAAAGAAAPEGRPQTERPMYTPEQVKKLSEEEEEFTQLLYIAQKYLNKVFTPRECEVFAYLYDGLQMSSELLEYLVEYCVQGGHNSIRYLETVGLNWHEKGIDTVEKAKKHTVSYSVEAFSVMRAFGLNDRRPGSTEMETIHRWFHEWGFTKELVLEACGRTLAATSKPSFAYADRILLEWKKAEVHSMADVRKLDEQHEQARAAQTDAGDGQAEGQTDAGSGRTDARGGQASGRSGARGGQAAGSTDAKDGQAAGRSDVKGGQVAGRSDARGGQAAGQSDAKSGQAADRTGARSGQAAGQSDAPAGDGTPSGRSGGIPARGGRVGGRAGAGSRNRFHNFEQRDTNYDAMALKQVKERLGEK